ncbi:PREDICTED: matrix metalloproteinase-2-like [Cyphomyrmex costatus]|uniref:matrix metalloproteinase-2-like n=1 Tax=Cyphomyrmex costatus TaxID=456900 RepID=UPI00085243C2|nr:PREDICTED: matrix metalloproteinase-2-like [Cyphomyrmex costatus]
MSLAFLVAFLSVTISASTPTIQNLVNVEVIEYLQKYGYLNEVDVTTHTSIEDEQIKQAIALFQEYYQIPDNGALNDNTLHQMRQPRCGLPDMSHQEQNSVVAKWRKTHLTWNFHLADADTLKTTAHAWLLHILISYREGFHTYVDSRRNEICSGLFDGPGGVLGHAFAPTNDLVQTTEIHIDGSEHWHIYLNENVPDNKVHLLYTLTHEIGHSLGMSHSTYRDSIMFLYVTNNTVKLSLEDSLAIQRLYGIKKPNVVPSTRSPPVTTNTTKTTSNKRDLCDLQYKGPIALNDYLPANVSINAAYQRPSGEIVIFANNQIYMIDYPSLRLKDGWPKRPFDLKLPTNMHVNAALVTNRGQTYVIFNDDSVALLNECDMTVNGYHTLQSIFPGIPPSPTLAFRYIDGSLYFLHKRQYYKFNEFTRTVTNADKFDMNILNVNCPTDGLLKQLQDLLTRLLQSSNSLTSTALNTEDD